MDSSLGGDTIKATTLSSSPKLATTAVGATIDCCKSCGCASNGHCRLPDLDPDATRPFGHSGSLSDMFAFVREFRAEMVNALSVRDSQLTEISRQLKELTSGQATRSTKGKGPKRPRIASPEPEPKPNVSEQAEPPRPQVPEKSEEKVTTRTAHSQSFTSYARIVASDAPVLSFMPAKPTPKKQKETASKPPATPQPKQDTVRSAVGSGKGPAFVRVSPQENEQRRVSVALQQLKLTDTRGGKHARQLMIADSHFRQVDGSDVCNSMHVVRVGGLCFPALEQALRQWIPENGERFTRVVVALGTNDLLHHREQGFDPSRAIFAVVKLLQQKFTNAKLQLMEPFTSPKLRRIRAPLDELISDLRRARGAEVLPGIDSRGFEFDAQGVHLQGESRLQFVREVSKVLGYGRNVDQKLDPQKEALAKLLSLFTS